MFQDLELADAARDGDTEGVKKMLAYGAHVHAWDDIAVRLAAKNGHTVAVAILIGAGADFTAKDNEALRLAEANGHVDTANLIRDAAKKLAPQNPGRRFRSENSPSP